MKIKQTMYAHFKLSNKKVILKECDLTNGGEDSFWSQRFLLLGKVEVEVELGFDTPSDMDIRDIKVDAIKGQIEKAKADHAVTIERLMGDIQKLMAIES